MYIIRKTNGEVQLVIEDGLTDTSLGITLVGRSYSNYGEAIANNFVKILENFANSIPPPNPMEGQLWYNTAESKLKIRKNNTWETVADKGSIGYAGSIGATGPQGIEGRIGYTGSRGNLGYTGSRGELGYTGSAGPVGPLGPEGPQGPIGEISTVPGPQGPIGFTGSRGLVGLQGPTGFTGSKGAEGPQGPAGPAGPAGGPTGPVGYVGSIGEPGPIGEVGPSGPQGETGATGPIGYTGSQGEIGYTGSQGSGFTGSQGEIGYTGSQGVIGFTGSQGVIGPIGPEGTIRNWILIENFNNINFSSNATQIRSMNQSISYYTTMFKEIYIKLKLGATFTTLLPLTVITSSDLFALGTLSESNGTSNLVYWNNINVAEIAIYNANNNLTTTGSLQIYAR